MNARLFKIYFRSTAFAVIPTLMMCFIVGTPKDMWVLPIVCTFFVGNNFVVACVEHYFFFGTSEVDNERNNKTVERSQTESGIAFLNHRLDVLEQDINRKKEQVAQEANTNISFEDNEKVANVIHELKKEQMDHKNVLEDVQKLLNSSLSKVDGINERFTTFEGFVEEVKKEQMAQQMALNNLDKEQMDQKKVLEARKSLLKNGLSKVDKFDRKHSAFERIATEAKKEQIAQTMALEGLNKSFESNAANYDKKIEGLVKNQEVFYEMVTAVEKISDAINEMKAEQIVQKTTLETTHDKLAIVETLMENFHVINEKILLLEQVYDVVRS